MKIDGSVALVTGTNRGLGKALVAALLGAGVSKVYAGSRSGDAAQADARVVPISLDTSKPEQIAAAVAKAGDVSLLINNAGVMRSFNLLAGSEADLEADLRTNLFGSLSMIRAFVPVLERAGVATIVNVLSVASLANLPLIGGYSVSKAAAYSMTQALRPELKAKKIDVLAALPGIIDTDMSKVFPIQKTSAAEVARGIVEGIVRGEEEIFPDPMSQQMGALWKKSPKDFERVMANPTAG